MKKIILSALLVANVSAQTTEFSPIIRQTYSYNNADKPNSVSIISGISGLTGSVQASEHVKKSVKFELFSVNTALLSGINEGNVDQKDFIKSHDSKTVSAYHPKANVKIQSVDQINGIAKTRVDSPFKVDIVVRGLVDDVENVQDAAKWVNIYHSYTEYATSSANGKEIVTAPESSEKIDTNGTFSYRQDSYTTQIPSHNLLTLHGEETIAVYAQPDFGFTTPTLLDSEKIIVLPLTTGVLTGISNGTEYKTIPEIKASLVNIYPGENDLGNVSSWSVICYRASERVSELTQSFIDEHVITSIPTTTYATPQSVNNQDINTAKIRKFCRTTGSGDYIVELIQSTVHGHDRMSDVGFAYATEVNINAVINSSE